MQQIQILLTADINLRAVPVLQGPNHANSGRQVVLEDCRYALRGR